MKDLRIGNLEFELTAYAKILYSNKFDPNNTFVHFRLKNLWLTRLPVKLTCEASDADKLFYTIRKTIADKPSELEKAGWNWKPKLPVLPN